MHILETIFTVILYPTVSVRLLKHANSLCKERCTKLVQLGYEVDLQLSI